MSTAATLLERFADASDALFEAGIIRSDSFAGDIGEFVASRTLGLELARKQSRAVDATRGGQRFQIKTTTGGESRLAIPLLHLVPGFDVLVGVSLSARFEPIEVVSIEASDLPEGARRIDERLLASIPCVRISTFPVGLTAVVPVIRSFGNAFMALLEGGAVSTRHIVGDIGARTAATVLAIQLSADPTNAGFDGVDDSGTTYEIKTRRVYESGRRTSGTRRVNGLEGKTADVLVVVQLDRAFRCAGMWTMPLRNVVNAKSANMRSVLKTPGIQRVV